MYGRGITDRHLDLSRVAARELTFEMRKEILETFFGAPYPTMIEPHSRYRQLSRKYENSAGNIKLAVEIFSTTEWRDLQVWSNLTWIDPMFRDEPPIAELFAKGRDFTEDDKNGLLDFQLELLKKIIPTYQKLFKENKIDVSFTPYYHPILPLLIDTDIAREAVSDCSLPKNRFRHPEDARWQIDNAIEKYQSLFGRKPDGMWPSEGSVSEETVKLLAASGLKWVATDEEILHYSLMKAGLNPADCSPYSLFTADGCGDTKILFRDHGLSDKIGFVYSGWNPKRAVADFIGHLRNIGAQPGYDPNRSVIPIILDGENAWEYFPNDGYEFLSRLYQALADDEQINVISMTEAAEKLPAQSLPTLFSGSWINHNFGIWIGHAEDNQAWDSLYHTRETLQKFQNENPDADKEMLKKAWEQIYIAEGSDWCWWFGDDHIGDHNEQFDRLYRHHLGSIYPMLGKEIPDFLQRPIFRGKTETHTALPEALVTPVIDGLLTHYYEWSGAGEFDCSSAGGAMHRVEKFISMIYFAFDNDSFYIRLDFDEKFDLVGKGKFRVVVDFSETGPKEILLRKCRAEESRECTFACDKILEVKFDRLKLISSGIGQVDFFVRLFSGEELIEKWPTDEPISVNLPDKDKTTFWVV
jgi:alpha-amylase/alpha-mannosidase (GH57 family)